MIYGTKQLSHMQLLGRILSDAQTTEDGKIAWLKLDEKLLNDYHVDPEDTHAFVNHLLILDNVLVACMFKQEGKNIKVSFRSAGLIDVGIIAQAFGGGGHNHSSATLIEGEIDTVIKETISDLKVMLAEH
jgi:phosphoesterase RecJ-like protein